MRLIEKCLDCGAAPGELHDLFCLKERCPFCHGQLAACDCISEVLQLSEQEQQSLDEYLDDSVPPLSDVMRRWRGALNAKGRVAFEPFPDDPWRAAYRGDLEALEAFQKDGYNLLAPNEVGHTPLMTAVKGEQIAVTNFLLAAGAGAELDERGYSALHHAVGQSEGNSVRQAACVTALLASGANVDARGDNGITPLMNAAWFGCRAAGAVLLKSGADPALLDEKGRSAASLAKERGHADFLELIQGKATASRGFWNRLLCWWIK